MEALIYSESVNAEVNDRPAAMKQTTFASLSGASGTRVRVKLAERRATDAERRAGVMRSFNVEVQ